VKTLNTIRRESAALQRLEGIEFLETENENLFAFIRRALDDVVIVVVNLDPRSAQEGVTIVPVTSGLPPAYSADELLTAVSFHWRIGRNFVRLDPGQSHILQVHV
jgi:starch synthase (maltosyl-transferring)